MATAQQSTAPAVADAPDGSAAGGDAGALVVFLVAVTCALAFSFLCSIFEAVLLSVSRGYVEKVAKASRLGRLLKRWKRTDIEVPIAAILILNTLAHTIGATVAGSSYKKAFSAETFGIFSVVFALSVLLFTEIIPKTLGVAFANRLAIPVTFSVRVLTLVLWPILKITSWISHKLTGDYQRPVTSIEEIRLLAALGEREGAVGERFASLIEGVASLRELTVHDAMIPRINIAFLSGNKSFKENLETVRTSGHSRFPFTPTGDLDDVEGIVLAKDLLFLDHDTHGDAHPDWSTLCSPLIVLPEGKQLDEVLRLFQEERKHLGVVVDEYGGTQGVITLEDVLEEIVGEIADETDREEELMQRLPDGSIRCRGRAETRKLFREFDIEEKVKYQTVGGFVADLLGHVPAVGETAEWENLSFRVTKASKRRVEQLVVTMRKVQRSAEEPPPSLDE